MQAIWRRRSILLVLLLGSTLLGVLGWMWTQARSASQQQIQAALSSGQQAQLQALADLQTRFTMDTVRIAEDPAFVAYVLAGRERGASGLASISDLLQERRGDLAAQSLYIFSAAGTALVGFGELERQASSIERWDALRQVLSSGEAISGWWVQDGGLRLLAIAPLRQGPLLEGLLLSTRSVDSTLLEELWSSSALAGHLYTEDSGIWRRVLGVPTDQAPTDTEVMQWSTQALAGLSAGYALNELPGVQTPIWLISGLTAQRQSELRSEQRGLEIGLGSVAAGLLVLLLWIWRGGRERGGPRLVVTGESLPQAPNSARPNDTQRGELLQEAVSQALAQRPQVRAEAATDDSFSGDARYQLISAQGSTALARIYRVDDRQLNRVMLLFVLHADTPRDTARSLRIATELGKAGLVQHRNLVSVQRVARSGPHLLVALDDVNGISLRELSASNTLPAAAAMLVAKRIAAAQLKLNEAGVLLRVIDPDQVLFLPDGSVKLLPLALSGAAQPASRALANLSAELWLAADKRSEVQAFGSLLGGMFGQPRTDLPGAWRELLEQCMEPPAHSRYPSMAEVVATLESL